MGLKMSAELADRMAEHIYRTHGVCLKTDVLRDAIVASRDIVGTGLSVDEASVIAAAVQLAPLLEEGWDDQDTPEDQNEGAKACDALVAAVNAMLRTTSKSILDPSVYDETDQYRERNIMNINTKAAASQEDRPGQTSSGGSSQSGGQPVIGAPSSTRSDK